MGASCGFGNAFWARTAALTSCAGEAHALCWSQTVFDGNGRESPSATLRNLDLVWYAQAILQLRKYDSTPSDGNYGPRTRAAVQRLQTDLGRSPTGVLDDELFARMLDAVDGPQTLATVLKRTIVEGKQAGIVDRAYGFAAAPAPLRSFSQVLGARPPDQQRLSLATILTVAGSKCSLPAISVSRQSDDIWSVSCSEGSYLLTYAGDSRLIVRTGGQADTPVPIQPGNAPGPLPPGRAPGR
jgi:peptidoglycan hydrolase-like protein with peptidoglycan-binding domain